MPSAGLALPRGAKLCRCVGVSPLQDPSGPQGPQKGLVVLPGVVAVLAGCTWSILGCMGWPGCCWPGCTSQPSSGHTNLAGQPGLGFPPLAVCFSIGLSKGRRR